MSIYTEEFLKFIKKHNASFDEIKNEMLAVIDLFKKDRLIAEFILNSPIDNKKKMCLISNYIKNKFLIALVSTVMTNKDLKNLMNIFEDIITTYNLENNNTINVVVVSVIPLDETQTNKIKQIVKNHSGMDSVITNVLNENIWGGCIIKFQDYIIDMSVKNTLEKIKRKVL